MGDMNVQDIKRLGYFDDVAVDGWVDPMYRSNGILIYQDMGLSESMNFCNRQSSNAIAHLHIDIFGIGNSNDTDNILCTRNNLGIYPDKYGRYCIGYADILIIKNEHSISRGVENKGRNTQAVRDISKTPDEMNLYEAGLRIAKYASKYKIKDKSFGDINVAIVDRVYIHNKFRRLGINTWIHQNIEDLINTFGMLYPDIIVLVPGDFSNESEELFGMTKLEYNNMLRDMYTGYGYKDINIIEKWITKIYDKNILFKINV